MCPRQRYILPCARKNTRQNASLPSAQKTLGKDDLSAVDYHNLMMANIDEVSDKWLQALKEIERGKLRVGRAYNKKVTAKSFQVGELVWKMILPLGTKSNKFS